MFRYFVFILILLFVGPSYSEDSFLTLKQQLDRLQREVSDLSKSVFAGSRDAQSEQKKQSETSPNLTALTAFDLRIYDLEKERDPKCYATANRLEDFMYGTPLEEEARNLKIDIQKELIYLIERKDTVFSLYKKIYLNNKNIIILPHQLLLFIIDPRDQPIVNDDLISTALGCTPSEAKLAQSLIVGLDLQKHAEKEGISYNTARRHLQSLFAKTETSSQVELVRRLIQIFGLLR